MIISFDVFEIIFWLSEEDCPKLVVDSLCSFEIDMIKYSVVGKRPEVFFRYELFHNSIVVCRF
jgi:hypothetical protein